MRPSANNQGRRRDEISCCLERNPLVSDKNLPESKQDKLSWSAVMVKNKNKTKKKPMGLEGQAEKQGTKRGREFRFP